MSAPPFSHVWGRRVGLTYEFGALGQAGVVKPIVGCLGPLLAAMDPAQWPGASKAFNLLLNLSLDHRPKIRKAAIRSLVEVLAVIKATEAQAPATQAVYRGKCIVKRGSFFEASFPAHRSISVKPYTFMIVIFLCDRVFVETSAHFQHGVTSASLAATETLLCI